MLNIGKLIALLFTFIFDAIEKINVVKTWF